MRRGKKIQPGRTGVHVQKKETKKLHQNINIPHQIWKQNTLKILLRMYA